MRGFCGARTPGRSPWLPCWRLPGERSCWAPMAVSFLRLTPTLALFASSAVSAGPDVPQPPLFSLYTSLLFPRVCTRSAPVTLQAALLQPRANVSSSFLRIHISLSCTRGQRPGRDLLIGLPFSLGDEGHPPQASHIVSVAPSFILSLTCIWRGISDTSLPHSKCYNLVSACPPPTPLSRMARSPLGVCLSPE